MDIVFVIVFAWVILDIAALKWGCDSREGVGSAEWEKRRHAALHAMHVPQAPFNRHIIMGDL